MPACQQPHNTVTVTGALSLSEMDVDGGTDGGRGVVGDGGSSGIDGGGGGNFGGVAIDGGGRVNIVTSK